MSGNIKLKWQIWFKVPFKFPCLTPSREKVISISSIVENFVIFARGHVTFYPHYFFFIIIFFYPHFEKEPCFYSLEKKSWKCSGIGAQRLLESCRILLHTMKIHWTPYVRRYKKALLQQSLYSSAQRLYGSRLRNHMDSVHRSLLCRWALGLFQRLTHLLDLNVLKTGLTGHVI